VLSSTTEIGNFMTFVVMTVEYAVFLHVRFGFKATVACRSLYAALTREQVDNKYLAATAADGEC
jgi:hypothetical protein